MIKLQTVWVGRKTRKILLRPLRAPRKPRDLGPQRAPDPSKPKSSPFTRRTMMKLQTVWVGPKIRKVPLGAPPGGPWEPLGASGSLESPFFGPKPRVWCLWEAEDPVFHGSLRARNAENPVFYRVWCLWEAENPVFYSIWRPWEPENPVFYGFWGAPKSHSPY